MRRRTRILAIAVAGAATFALPTAANALFIVNQPWLLPAGKAQSTRAFMNLTSTDGATLVRAHSEDARKVTIRSGRSPASPSLALPAGCEVPLAPGGDHLTLAGVTRNLRLGNRVVLVLVVCDGDGSTREIPISAEVRQRSPLDDERRAHRHRQ